MLLSGAGALTGGPLVLLLFVSGPLSAGDSASSQAGITLNLIDDLSVTEQEPLAFPSVVQGETDAVEQDEAAEFRVDGEPNEPIAIQVDESIALEGPGGTVPVELEIHDGASSISTQLPFSGSVNFPVNGRIPAGGIPEEPGQYTGSFTVRVDYE